MRTRRRSESAFTLIELLVVIVLIVVLMTLVSVILVRVIDRARVSKTLSLVQTLNQGCQMYLADFNAAPKSATFPSDGMLNSGKTLHELLGKELNCPVGLVSVAGQGPPPATKKVGPYVRWQADWLEPGGGVEPNPARNPMDAWGRPMYYRTPGMIATVGWDIWSKGPDDSNVQATWIGNWERHTVQ